MANIQLEDAMRLAAADGFWALRGKAIQSYANIEQSLAMLFGALAGTDQKTANIIFFKITNADARNKIIEKLFQNKFDIQHNLFRNSLMKHLGPIDRERNEIVHWNVVNQVGVDATGTTTSVLALMPPANWADTLNAPKKVAEEMRAFAVKCDFFSRLLNTFSLYVIKHEQIPQEDWVTWLPIFDAPITYPPADDHPLKPGPELLTGPNHFHIS